MARLIDADALIDDIFHSGLTYYEKAKELIDYQPTIDAQPVIHAKWVKSEYGDARWHKCTNCNTHDYYQTEYKGHLFKSVRNYCPYCGAKMDADKL